jgi:hypothetical protein
VSVSSTFGTAINENKMFGHPRIYFDEFDRLSEKTQERENLISAVASIYRLTPQYANEVYREWKMSRRRGGAAAA